MAAVAPHPQPLGLNGQAHTLPNGPSTDKKASGLASSTSHMEKHSASSMGAHGSQPNDANARAPASKKVAAKKATDPSETSKLLAAKISQLELDKAGEKDQEAEIDREVKRANRDLSSLLSNIESPLSRLEIVQKKYTDLLADMRRLDREYAKSKKRAEQLQKERDAGRTELSKMIAMKEKMEKLSRELQKEKQKLKEENKRLEETDRKKIEQLNERMDAMLWEVQDVTSQKEDPGIQKLDVKTEELFKSRFKTLIDQYELREQIFAHTLRKKEMEVQANMARFENEKKAAEQEVARSRDLRVQVATFSQTETELRSQLNVYVEKFKQVEDTLNNSNDLFLTFRKEMEDMSRKTKRLEKENLALIKKHDQTSCNILEMAEERTRMNKEMELLKKKNANLEKLCRGMQAQGRGMAAAPSTSSLPAKTIDGIDENEHTESDFEYEEDDEEDDDEDDDEDVDEEDDDDEEEVEDEDGYMPTTEQKAAIPRVPTPIATNSLSHTHGLGRGQANIVRRGYGGMKPRRGPIYGSVPAPVPVPASVSSVPSSAAVSAPGGRMAQTATNSRLHARTHSATANGNSVSIRGISSTTTVKDSSSHNSIRAPSSILTIRDASSNSVRGSTSSTTAIKNGTSSSSTTTNAVSGRGGRVGGRGGISSGKK